MPTGSLNRLLPGLFLTILLPSLVLAQTDTSALNGRITDAQGGAIAGAQIVLNLSRMNRVRAVDAVNNTITVEAGCVLANLQQAAAAAGRLFPLSLAA